MIILAVEKSFDKGKAFENFISILLAKSGYKILSIRVRKAGRELDIQAVSKVTGTAVLIECKAEAAPIRSSAYNKFYGIFEHEAKREQATLIGLLISLSGFTGDVVGNYQEKTAADKERFKIHGPEFVTELAVDAGLIINDATVRTLASKSWPFGLGETLLVITTSQLYRVQLLERKGSTTHFIVYRANGEDPTDYEIGKVQEATSMLKNLECFNLLTRKEVLLALSQAHNKVDSYELSRKIKQSVATIENEIAFLKERKLVTEGRKGFQLSRDVRAFCEVSIELLQSDHKYDFLLSHYYHEMNDGNLANFVLSRRCLKAKNVAEQNLICNIFRFSPSALMHALFGNAEVYETTYKHAQALNKDIDSPPIALKYAFFRELSQHLLPDIREGNKVMDSLETVVGFLEAYHLKLANSLEVFFDIEASGISTRLKAGEDLEAGQLITIRDPLTRFNLGMTTLNLTGDPKAIEELITIYRELAANDPEKSELPALANNIGVCFMAVRQYEEAQDWFNEGVKYNRHIPELSANLEKVRVIAASA